MYARIVTINLKPNRLSDFTETLDKNVIPMLRKQQGFKEQLALARSNGTEIRTIGFWDSKENADTYHGGTYPQVMKAFGDMIDGTPQVNQFEVVQSTYHKIPALATL